MVVTASTPAAIVVVVMTAPTVAMIDFVVRMFVMVLVFMYLLFLTSAGAVAFMLMRMPVSMFVRAGAGFLFLNR